MAKTYRQNAAIRVINGAAPMTGPMIRLPLLTAGLRAPDGIRGRLRTVSENSRAKPRRAPTLDDLIAMPTAWP